MKIFQQHRFIHILVKKESKKFISKSTSTCEGGKKMYKRIFLVVMDSLGIGEGTRCKRIWRFEVQTTIGHIRGSDGFKDT